MSRRASQACDACRYRKVKCNGARPCPQCAHLNLYCDFSDAPARRKPGGRGRLVAQLRRRQVPRSDPGVQNLPVSFFLELLPQFSQFVYPVNPIIPPHEMRKSIYSMHDNTDDQALFYAFAAVTINRTRTYLTSHSEFAELMADLISRSLKAQREGEINGYDGQGGGILGRLPVNIKRVVTCIFLGVCMVPFGQFERSFAILREAITMLQTLDIHRWQATDGTEARWRDGKGYTGRRTFMKGTWL